MPPVCKILDFGKYKYQAQKKAAEARKKQKVVEVKEVKLRPKIDTMTTTSRCGPIERFFDDGDKVKVTCASAAVKWLTRNWAWSCL